MKDIINNFMRDDLNTIRDYSGPVLRMHHDIWEAQVISIDKKLKELNNNSGLSKSELKAKRSELAKAKKETKAKIKIAKKANTGRLTAEEISAEQKAFKDARGVELDKSSKLLDKQWDALKKQLEARDREVFKVQTKIEANEGVLRKISSTETDTIDMLKNEQEALRKKLDDLMSDKNAVEEQYNIIENAQSALLIAMETFSNYPYEHYDNQKENQISKMHIRFHKWIIDSESTINQAMNDIITDEIALQESKKELITLKRVLHDRGENNIDANEEVLKKEEKINGLKEKMAKNLTLIKTNEKLVEKYNDLLPLPERMFEQQASKKPSPTDVEYSKQYNQTPEQWVRYGVERMIKSNQNKIQKYREEDCAKLKYQMPEKCSYKDILPFVMSSEQEIGVNQNLQVLLGAPEKQNALGDIVQQHANDTHRYAFNNTINTFVQSAVDNIGAKLQSVKDAIKNAIDAVKDLISR